MLKLAHKLNTNGTRAHERDLVLLIIAVALVANNSTD